MELELSHIQLQCETSSNCNTDTKAEKADVKGGATVRGAGAYKWGREVDITIIGPSQNDQAPRSSYLNMAAL